VKVDVGKLVFAHGVCSLSGIVFAEKLIVKLVDVIRVFLARIGDPDCPKRQPDVGGLFFDLGNLGQCGNVRDTAVHCGFHGVGSLGLTWKWQVASAECVINLEQRRINSVKRRINISASVVLRH
jgi:hypothetical protein